MIAPPPFATACCATPLLLQADPSRRCLAALRRVPSHPLAPWAQVLFVGDGLAIVEGLENDAPIGTLISFVSGATGWAALMSLVHGSHLPGSSCLSRGPARCFDACLNL